MSQHLVWGCSGSAKQLTTLLKHLLLRCAWNILARCQQALCRLKTQLGCRANKQTIRKDESLCVISCCHVTYFCETLKPRLKGLVLKMTCEAFAQGCLVSIHAFNRTWSDTLQLSHTNLHCNLDNPRKHRLCDHGTQIARDILFDVAEVICNCSHQGL